MGPLHKAPCKLTLREPWLLCVANPTHSAFAKCSNPSINRRVCFAPYIDGAGVKVVDIQ